MKCFPIKHRIYWIKSKYKFSELKDKGEELIEKGKVKVEEAKDIIVEKVKKGKKKLRK